jgi:putative oxidoreductase
MNPIHNALALLGRIAFAAFFIPSGIAKLTGYAGTAAYMAAHGVPTWLLPLVIITELGGGLLLLLGWHTRIVAFLLGGFSLVAVLLFWMHPTDQIGMIVRSAELAVAGGLWFIAARGDDGWSIDGLLARRHGSSKS